MAATDSELEALGTMLVYVDDYDNGPKAICEHGTVRWPLDGSGPVIEDTDEHNPADYAPPAG